MNEYYGYDQRVPIKSYKAGEIVNCNTLQSLINKCNKAIDKIEDKIDDDMSPNEKQIVDDQLGYIKINLSAANDLMKNLVKKKDINSNEVNNESIILNELLEFNREKIINESFNDIDKLLNNIHGMKIQIKSLNETTADDMGPKIRAIYNAYTKAKKIIIRKLRTIISQILATLKRIRGINRIKSDGYYIDIEKAMRNINEYLK